MHWEGVSPFSDEYVQQELAAFQVPDGTSGNMTIKHKSARGRIDGYMHKEFGELANIPVLQDKDKVWMSVTPMEVQSHYMPILLAEGKVGVGGLGLGYYVQRILAKPEVESVTVYELDPDVIALYRQNFGEHPKLTIKQEDMRQMKGETYDFFYADIYPQLVDEQAIPDMGLLVENNEIGHYHFWGIEQAVGEMLICHYDLPFSLKAPYLDFLQHLLDTKGGLQKWLGNGHFLYKQLREAGLVHSRDEE